MKKTKAFKFAEKTLRYYLQYSNFITSSISFMSYEIDRLADPTKLSKEEIFEILENVVNERYILNEVSKAYSVNNGAHFISIATKLFLKENYDHDIAIKILHCQIEIFKQIKEYIGEDRYSNIEYVQREYVSYNDDDNFKRFSSLIGREDTNLNELEEMIESNLDCFLYNFDFMGDRKFLKYDLQRYFPFSYDFIAKHIKYFNLNIIGDNPLVMRNISSRRLILGKLAEDTLTYYISHYTNSKCDKKIRISEEELDSLLLQYEIMEW